ncbi:DUF962 domain-containing protein [Tumebacillus flagellatus]|uniref:Membrane protein n=1 Tax=Tumebacillus flagellatus TaxID=1157490 RepID=A0A074MC35_9BACL|nr:DUF962 domain-containing protein [Tumebacillus flagellatus]KEO83457.1 membrane protein [Tumebacillus flagellatus]
MYRSYEEFWVYYVSEHMKRSTRIWHAVGTFGVVVLLVWILWQQAWWWLLLVPVLGYGPAWFSHFFLEKNRPATFTYPLWSLRADFRMFRLLLLGQMGVEIKRAETWLANQKL